MNEQKKVKWWVSNGEPVSVVPEGMEPPGNFQEVDGVDGSREDVYFNGTQVVWIPKQPANASLSATWDGKSWVEKNTLLIPESLEKPPLNRSQFLIEIIQTQAFSHVSQISSERGGAIANELSSLKALINSSPDILPDSYYSSLLQRCTLRSQSLLAVATPTHPPAPWTTEHISQINSVLELLGVSWAL